MNMTMGRFFRWVAVLMIFGVIGLVAARNETVQAQEFPYECSAIFVPNNRTTNAGRWTEPNYTHELWMAALSATPIGGPDVWKQQPTMYSGQSITSQECNNNGSGGPRHAPNAAGDLVNVNGGQMNATDGTRPSGLWLGLQRNDAVAKGAGGQINNGLWQAPGSSGVPPGNQFRPPVFQYNWRSASALADDSGAFVINGELIWCAAYVNNQWHHRANNGQCGPSISQGGGSPNGAGSLMNQSNCNLSNPAAIDPNIPPDTPADGALCTDPAFSWIKTPGRNENIAGTAGLINGFTGLLNNFEAHTAARNTVSGGWGAATWLQVDYPNVSFDFTPTCGGVSYAAANPLYPAYAGAIPQITFTFNGGSPTPATGTSGTVARPAGVYGNIQVRGQVTLSGKPFDVIKTVNCMPPPQCGSTTFTPVSSDNTYEANQPIQANITVQNPQGGWNVVFSVPGAGLSSGAVPLNMPGGDASWPFSIATPGVYQVQIRVNYNYYGTPGTLICDTQLPTGGSATCHPSYVICDEPVKIVLKPYVKMYGGDVLAGSGFNVGGGVCNPNNNPNARIISWNQNGGSYGGSGTQFGTFALNGIRGFSSAQGSNTGIGLSFANTGANPVGDNYGGFFGNTGVSLCAKDYYHQNGNPTALPNIPAVTAVPGATGNYFRAGALTITGTAGVGGQVTIYAQEDVYIQGNIIFSAGAFANTATAPYFAVITAPGKNIYIDRNVQQLDGLFVATGGTIYTCSAGFSPVPVNTSYHGNCANKLIVNGALVAKQVKFMRTSGSLSQGAGDQWGAGRCLSAVSCTSSGAEVVNYSPLLWLNAPVDDDAPVQFDSVVGLPPVL